MSNEMQAAFYIVTAGCLVYLAGKPAAASLLVGIAAVFVIEYFK